LPVNCNYRHAAPMTLYLRNRATYSATATPKISCHSNNFGSVRSYIVSPRLPTYCTLTDWFRILFYRLL